MPRRKRVSQEDATQTALDALQNPKHELTVRRYPKNDRLFALYCGEVLLCTSPYKVGSLVVKDVITHYRTPHLSEDISR